jgi:hypothetical protein
VISPVGVWEVETGSVGLCWYVVVREKVEVAYVLLHGLELLGSVLVVVSFGCLRWHYAFAVKTHS